jgi:predicted ATPase/class 3 adenylate cyclase
LRCSSCGVDDTGGHRFCGACGSLLASRRCPSCGAAVAADAKFCGDCGAPLSAERRQLTIVFVDLVGSTALASRLDPEDLQDVVRVYQAAVTTVVERFGGSVAQYLGDGLLLYFGYPQAQENAAESAVRAALEIVRTVRGLATPPDVALAVRVGIATGLVVIGDVRSGAVAERLAIGETPNLAARIQALASEHAVLVSDSTRHVLGGQFDLEDEGEHVLKGFEEPVQVWRVAAERHTATRFQAMRSESVAPLLGRTEELRRIIDVWERAAQGTGGIALVIGEPGMGKSRLMLAALQAPALREAATVCLQCSPYHAQSAFYPLLGWLRAEVAAAEDPEGRLVAMVERAGLPAAAVRRFADLLGADFAPRHPAAAPGTPEHELRETSLGFLALLVAAVGGAPLALAIEDLHWADPSTLAFVDLLAARIRGTSIMLLTSMRPAFVPGWVEQATFVPVEQLDPQAAARLIESTAGVTMSPELVARIVSHTDGVPLFLEELTKTVIESAVDAAGRTDVALPATLRDSLTARLDRLERGKPVAQLAATLGRHFDGRVLAAVWHGSEERLQEGVEELLDAYMIFGPAWPSDGRYAFKHALVQEAAYESLLLKERRAEHANIARVLEDAFPDVVATEPELVARHHAAGRCWEPAARRWLDAGQHALAQNAHREAVGHLEAAREAAANLPAGASRDAIESDALLALLPALIAARGYGHPSVEEAGAACLQHCAGADPMRRFTALFPLCTFHMVRANHGEALRLAEELHAIASTAGAADLRIEANLVLGLCRFFVADLPAADAHLDACLAEYDPDRHGAHAQQFGQDPAVVALSYRSWMRWLEGDLDASWDASTRAIERARAGGHALSLSFALSFAAWRSVYAGDGAGARPWVAELLALCERQAIPVFHIHGRLIDAWLACADGRVGEGVPALRAALRAFEATGSQCYLSLWLAFLAGAEWNAGEQDAARATFDRAVAEMERSGEAWSRPEVLRIGARLATARGDDAAAARLLDEAVAHAATSRTRSWETRAARDRAALGSPHDGADRPQPQRRIP